MLPASKKERKQRTKVKYRKRVLGKGRKGKNMIGRNLSSERRKEKET